MKTSGTLYVVATPIGNPGDITLRALEILNQVDFVICEELREGSTLLKKLGVVAHELIALNEHNETTLVPELVNRLVLKDQKAALISDCGTPVFADPGHFLINQAVMFGAKIVPVPGPSSVMAALSILDFKLERFIFAGFLPRPPEIRRKELLRLKALRMPVIIMDTPYRLGPVLTEIVKVFGKNQAITLALELTLPRERILRGSVSDILNQVNTVKAEFVLIVH